MNSIDLFALLADLIRAKSYSGQEAAAAAVVEVALTSAGLAARRIGDNIVCQRGTGDRTLLLNSHLDTVPASAAWTRDPWTPTIEDGLMYGLGATDAKSCVAAMLTAFVAAADPGPRGRLIFSATVNEETGGSIGPSGMEMILPSLGPLHGAIVGEPTRLDICPGQRGLVRIVVHAEGQAGHASRPWEGVNAIEKAAADILSLKQLSGEVGEDFQDPVSGKPTIQATLIAGGSAANVIPDRCDITLDVRTTRFWSNATAIAQIRDSVRSPIEVKSKRFLPVATDTGDPLIALARKLLPQAAVRPFGGVSDMYFLGSIPGGAVPAFLLGPGDGRQSHQADEFVRLEMVRNGAEAYRAIADAFWG